MGAPISRDFGVLVVGDLPPIQSPIDGKVLGGRRQLREYMKEKNLAHADEVKPDWDREAKKREAFYSGDPSYDRQRRVERIKNSIEQLQARRRR